MFNRLRIKGLLTTGGPVHVGNGEPAKRPELFKVKPGTTDRIPIEIAAVATDFQGRAYLPGKTIKGNLRAWLDRSGVAPRLVDSVFGSRDPDAKDAVGGKAEFRDAFSHGDIPDLSQRVPYWDRQRLAGVGVSAVIDKRTRTTANAFHEEFVPKGIGFELVITGQDMTDDELHLLLFALDGFNGKGATLGAGTADAYGEFTWQAQEIARMEEGDVATWLAQPSPAAAYDGLKPLPAEKLQAAVRSALSKFAPRATGARLKLKIEIAFDGPFLVNDPRAVNQKKENPRAHAGKPDHFPLRDTDGKIVLPPASLRGALRAQAERIIRTLNPAAACSEDPPCTAIQAKSDTGDLCLACRLFGGPGWRTPIEFSPFTPLERNGRVYEGDPHCQENVAIDRFTGGVSGSAKFNTEAKYQPILEGRVTLDLARIPPWGLGLLALTVRDFMEGDITLGFGAAKGYGGCTATIAGIELCGDALDPELQRILDRNRVRPEQLGGIAASGLPQPEIRNALNAMLADFRTTVAGYGRNNNG